MARRLARIPAGGRRGATSEAEVRDDETSVDGPCPPRLAALAERHGVATTWRDHAGVEVVVPTATVRAVLRAMGVEAPDEATADRALAEARARESRLAFPEVQVVRRPTGGDGPGAHQQDGHVATLRSRDARRARLVLEDGTVHDLGAGPELPVPREVPLGYHRLELADDPGAAGAVIVAPDRCPVPQRRRWGWMTQLYQLRSSTSWGMGDASDLRALAERTAPLGADFVVCNPLHASTPAKPVQASPYFPSSRRFLDPLYVRVADVPETRRLDAAGQARIAALDRAGRELNEAAVIDYDRVLDLKLEALALVHAAGRSDGREADLADFRARGGRALEQVATFFALAEEHGPSWRDWPEALHDPEGPAVSREAQGLRERVELHVWLQWVADEQLATTQRAARAAGMAVGVVHDLAVGVDPGGADAWALAGQLARDVRVGAPPDAFNQQGQDWGQPPLRPDALRRSAFRPVRDMLSTVLAHAGGVRIDHVLGLFRLFWIPEGAPPTQGTYVRYPGEELLAVLALEAHRADALVVGEDLGTMEPWVRDRLAGDGVLSSRVLYFEHVEGARTPAEAYPERALATVTTHDLPTATGWWRDASVRLQAELGLLGEGRTEADELERSAHERASMRRLLHDHGLAAPDADDRALVEAMHAFLASTPSVLVAASPADVVGDTRQPNLPGTRDEYPNWRLPLAEPTALGPRQVSLDDLLADPRLQRFAGLLRRPER